MGDNGDAAGVIRPRGVRDDAPRERRTAKKRVIDTFHMRPTHLARSLFSASPHTPNRVFVVRTAYALVDLARTYQAA